MVSIVSIAFHIGMDKKYLFMHHGAACCGKISLTIPRFKAIVIFARWPVFSDTAL
jgi:hypothetical protein